MAKKFTTRRETELKTKRRQDENAEKKIKVFPCTKNSRRSRRERRWLSKPLKYLSGGVPVHWCSSDGGVCRERERESSVKSKRGTALLTYSLCLRTKKESAMGKRDGCADSRRSCASASRCGVNLSPVFLVVSFTQAHPPSHTQEQKTNKKQNKN